MLTTDYDIVAPEMNQEVLAHAGLFMEVSEQSLTALWMDRKEKKVYRVVRYPNVFPHEPMQVRQLKEIFSSDPLFSLPISVSGVVYNYSECQLFPASLYSIELNKPLTELVAGNLKKGLVLSEKVKGHEIYAIYKIPRGIHELFQQTFSAGHYWHLYTLLLMQAPEQTQNKGFIRLVFYTEKLIACIFDEGSPLYLQSYAYEQPEDVSWFLLTLCREFNMDPSSTELLISGMIDASSASFTELEKYFPRRNFDKLDDDLQLAATATAFPPHYFSNILKMALCV